MAISGAIIDFDGTLVDTLDAWRSLEGELMGEAQGEVTLEDRAQLTSFTLDETAQWFHTRFGLGASPAALRRQMDDYMVAFLERSAKPFAGVEAFLESCARAGVKMAVASSSPQLYLQTALKATGLSDYFIAVLSVEDMGVTKREPTVFDRAREILGTPRRTTWGIEDSLYALRVLREAGYPTVGIYDPHEQRTFEEWQQDADVVVRGFSELSLATLEAYPTKG